MALQQPDRSTRTVIDRPDDGDLSAQLGAGDVAAGFVVVRPVPGVASAIQVAVDLLVALGKRFDALEREDRSEQAWPLVRVWLRAEVVRHLVVVHADRLPPRMWSRLDDLAVQCDLQLWLISSVDGDPGPTAPPAWRRSGAAALLRVLATVEPSPGEDRELSTRVRQIVTPATACAFALAASATLDVETLSTLNVGDVAPAGRRVSVDHAAAEMSSACRGAVRAQLLCRLARGAGDHDPLFVDEWGRRAPAHRLEHWMQRALSGGPIRDPRERPWPPGPRCHGARLTVLAAAAPPRADIGAAVSKRRPRESPSWPPRW